MVFAHLFLAVAWAAEPARFGGVPLATAEAIFQIEVQRMPPESLLPLLSDVDPTVRARAAVAAGRLHAPAVLLAGLAADGDANVRLAAARALGFGTDTVALVRARLPLESDPRVVAALLEALGRVGEASDVATVIAALDTRHANTAARALGRMGSRKIEGPGGEVAVTALLDTLKFPIGETRRSAAWALSRIPLAPPSEALRARMIEAALHDSESRVRAWLIRGVAPFVHEPSVFATAANDGAMEVRLAAVRAMAKHGCDGPALTARLGDVEAGVRAEALTAAATCAAVDVAPLREALTQGTAAERAAALRTLKERKALPAALAEFQTAAWPLPVRIAAVESMDERPRLLRIALRNADPRLRSAAAGVILGGDEAPRANEIVELLAASDFVLVQAASEAAIEHPDPALEKQLLTALARKELPRAGAIATVRALDALYATGRLPHPNPDAKAAIRRWLSVPELAAASQRLAATLSLDPPQVRHPERALPSLADVAKVRSARVFTTEGEVRIELLSEVAPLTVWNFVTLAEKGYFNGLTFHRVVPDFVAQTGDPRGDGWGGPGYEIPDELSAEDYSTGAVGMALSGPDTGGSQWFITTAPQPHLDFGYTVFGRVTLGMRAARAIDVEDTIVRVVIERAE
ncbi:hypothetical protein LBMAG42_30600 [Deltaproteobacteria bacterium]|nr:hypothetical protein LBMAG42_30600 [Deltaproteobacteria bacterium]